jgi:hypothetical protein
MLPIVNWFGVVFKKFYYNFHVAGVGLGEFEPMGLLGFLIYELGQGSQFN